MEFGYRRIVLPSPRHPAPGGASPLRTRAEPLKRPVLALAAVALLMLLALKSGNFGAPDFFTKAFHQL